MDGKAIAFSFSKKIEKKNLQPSALRGSVLSKDANTAEIIESIEENVIKSNAPLQTETIIPLVKEDRASAIESLRKRAALKKQQNTPAVANDETETKPDRELTLDERAEQALLQEARVHANVTTQRDPGTIEGAGATGKQAGECSTLDDYDEVGVESFGAAMLRGMGWNNDGVGRPKVRKVVPTVGAVNKTLSGVATRAPGISAPQEREEKEALPLVKGALVLVHLGRHKGTYGVVEEVEVEYLLVRRALARSVGGEAVLREVPGNITVVTATHYKQNSRIMNKKMFDEATAEQELKKKKKRKKRSRSSDDSSDADTKEKSGPEQSQGIVKTESLPDHQSSSSSLLKEGVNEEPAEIQNTLKIEQLDDDDNSTNNSETPISTSKHALEESSHKNGVETDDNPVSVPSLKKDKRPVPVDESVSNVAHREETLRSDRKRTSKDCLKYNDGERKNASHRSDRQSPGRRPSKNETKPYSQSSSVRCSEHDARHSSHRDSENERHHHKKSRYYNSESQHKKGSQREGYESRDNKDYLSSKYGDASVNARHGVEGDRQHRGAAEGRKKAPWVREGLTVRIVSEDYKRGKYFKQKVRVMSVLTAVSCECRTEEGKVLRDVPPSCLETVIPKQQPRLVLVLRGQLSGQVAVILEQHKLDQEASVQLLDDRSVIARLGYEDICQYNR